MGTSHARAYHRLEGFDLVGLVSRGAASRDKLSQELGGTQTFADFDAAFAATKPDVVSINTYPDTHAALAEKALRGGAHVFVEKPLAETVAQAQAIVDLAKKHERKVVVGYILRVHPAWQKFIEIARTLGKPLVMRMNLNQQSRGKDWSTHRALMDSMSPIVDCGVHYVDVMCQMTRAKPVRVSAIHARLTDELKPGMYNYGQLQVAFDDGSVGWYEAGWGPMMSEVAYFVKDVISPRGAVSILSGMHPASASVEGHTRVGCLRIHRADGTDEDVDFAGEPGHQALCDAEQAFLLRAIAEDRDLARHMEDAVASLAVCLAADESIRTGRTVHLDFPG